MSLRGFGCALLLAPVAFLLAGTAGAQPPPAPPSIQDNSFLLEEAYNQEAGVVQTIQTYTRVAGSGDWVWALTQEWPVPDEKNQLSVTIQFLGLSGPDGVSRGFGDLLLNYRYQLAGDGAARVALAPRATVVIPSGDYKRGLGAGGVGLQGAIPLSLVLSERFVAHTNLDATLLGNAKSPAGTHANLWSASIGQSVVWLAHPNVNLLVEAVAARSRVFSEDGTPALRTDIVVSPGIRAALNLPGRVQIVPGFAVPIGVGPSAGKTSILGYLSVELPVF